MKKLAAAAVIFAGILTVAGAALKWSARQERLNKIEQAKKDRAPELTITIIEGWSSEDIGHFLEKQGIMNAAEFIKVEKNFPAAGYEELLASKPASQDLEGFLFPDTYRIMKSSGNPGGAIIKKMLDNFSIKLTDEMRREMAAKKSSLYEIVILASIIEKETGRNAATDADKTRLLEERKVVAGIFYNRLKAGLPLQSDATINYLTKKNTPTPSEQDLQADSPYNTYRHKGLPPGPICNPSLSSIIAAIYPAPNPYYYFLHKQPSGEVVYGKTFEEHVKNKIKYLK